MKFFKRINAETVFTGSFGIYFSGFVVSMFSMSYNDATKASKEYLKITKTPNKTDELKKIKNIVEIDTQLIWLIQYFGFLEYLHWLFHMWLTILENNILFLIKYYLQTIKSSSIEFIPIKI